MKKSWHWSDMFPSWFNRIHARFRGYFWLPCPECGKEFGGHQIRPIPEGVRMVPLLRLAASDRISQIPCPDCDANEFITMEEYRKDVLDQYKRHHVSEDEFRREFLGTWKDQQ